MTSAGYLYVNGNLAEKLGIDDSRRYLPAVIKKGDIEYPAIIEDAKGNKFSKTYRAYMMHAQALKSRFKMENNLKVSLEPFEGHEQKGFLLLNPGNPSWLLQKV